MTSCSKFIHHTTLKITKFKQSAILKKPKDICQRLSRHPNCAHFQGMCCQTTNGSMQSSMGGEEGLLQREKRKGFLDNLSKGLIDEHESRVTYWHKHAT